MTLHISFKCEGVSFDRKEMGRVYMSWDGKESYLESEAPKRIECEWEN